MDAEDLNGEPRTVCAGVFTGKSSAPDIRDEPLWVLGDAFMRNVLTAYVHPPSSSPHKVIIGLTRYSYLWFV